MYDSKGPKCQEMGSYPNCDGDFEASEACCVCQSGDKKNKRDFCCNFGVTTNNQAICELYTGSKIVDQNQPAQLNPSVAVTYQLDKRTNAETTTPTPEQKRDTTGLFLIKYADLCCGSEAKGNDDSPSY